MKKFFDPKKLSDGEFEPREQKPFVGRITHAEIRENRWGRTELYMEIQPEGKSYVRKAFYAIPDTRRKKSSFGRFILALEELDSLPGNDDPEELIGLKFLWEPTSFKYRANDGTEKESYKLIPTERIMQKRKSISEEDEGEEGEEETPAEDEIKEVKVPKEKPKSAESKKATYTEADIQAKLVEFVGAEPLTMQEIFGEMAKHNFRKRDIMLAVGKLVEEKWFRKTDDGKIVSPEEEAISSEEAGDADSGEE